MDQFRLVLPLYHLVPEKVCFLNNAYEATYSSTGADNVLDHGKCFGSQLSFSKRERKYDANSDKSERHS